LIFTPLRSSVYITRNAIWIWNARNTRWDNVDLHIITLFPLGAKPY
jgi:hypothetical protein